MKSEAFETILGAIVVALAAGFFLYTYNVTDSGRPSGYELTAKFNRVTGITPGTDVRMSGIKIGTVTSQELDTKTFLAVIRMDISSQIEIPDDSSVKISSESLLGGSYLNVEPGGSLDNLAAGGEIQYTQGSVDVMDLLGQAIFAVGGDSE